MVINKRKVVIFIISVIIVFIISLIITLNNNYKKGYSIFLIKKIEWETKNLKNYQYHIKKSGNCKTYYFDIISNVEKGNYFEDDDNLNYNFAGKYMTIENIYNEIEIEYKNNENDFIKGIFYRINIEYDNIYHYPRKIKYSWIPLPFVFDYGSYIVYDIDNFMIK
jgi:hypothetical protein